MESMAVEWTWSFAMIVCDPANLFPRTCFWGTTFSAQRCHMRFQPLTCALYVLQSAESSHVKSPNLKAFRKLLLSTKYIPSMIYFCKRYMNLHCSCNQYINSYKNTGKLRRFARVSTVNRCCEAKQTFPASHVMFDVARFQNHPACDASLATTWGLWSYVRSEGFAIQHRHRHDFGCRKQMY